MTRRTGAGMLSITFFSNFLNNHQLPLALELSSMAGVDYHFVSLLDTAGTIGRPTLDKEYDFVIREYKGEREKSLAVRHVMQDDVVVFGDMAGKEKYVKIRMKTGKLMFRYAERLLKRGDWLRHVPLKKYRTYDQFVRYMDSPLYVLCASAFTGPDLELFGFPLSRCFRWGYFPKVAASRPSCRFHAEDGLTLLSAQRLIGWKRVDLQIELAAKLKRSHRKFKLRVAGAGDERRRLLELASVLNVEDCVEFIGELDSDMVGNEMSRSDIFLATSNRKEGWGATVNEAMSAGCCVVASDEMGCSPFLITQDKDGLLFESGNLDSLYSTVNPLFDDVKAVARIGERAAVKINTIWCARVAAARFVEAVSSYVRNGSFDSCSLHDDGPMSPLLKER